ncbi:9409_t:CDS:2 [Racocetra persica]|uniref:9409_t:CDS:1 n=1 Tax=Racocetra persica TaxID=160502 RepID=A0ACA9QNR2_9GLOM|nr:9409_t:CDS:2 [Racocetra persica]
MSTTDLTNDPSATMSYKSFFSYKNDNINIIYADNNIQIRIERVTSDVASVNTTNNQNESIHNNSFYITWVPNYILFHNGAKIFRLKNQKQQAIKGAIDLETDVIQQ